MKGALRTRLITTGILLLTTLGGGTAGYYLLGNLGRGAPGWQVEDCLYMTVITLTTVGYGETLDVGTVPGGRIFTMILLFCGLGVSAYFLSTLTAFIVEGELKNVYWRKRMSKAISSLSGHIILCGAGRVGEHILGELRRTGRHMVVIEQDEERIIELQGKHGEFPALVGDPTHGDILLDAGLKRAHGVISTLGDDKDNLCVVVTCRQLNPAVRVISRCNDHSFAGRLELVGAQVVIPDFIGGLRMASQMIRPKVVHYLDAMLRDTNCVVRIEEFPVGIGSRLVGGAVGSLDLGKHGNILLLAIVQHGNKSPVYNPPPEHKIAEGDMLVFQAEQGAFSRFSRTNG